MNIGINIEGKIFDAVFNGVEEPYYSTEYNQSEDDRMGYLVEETLKTWTEENLLT